MCNTLQVWGSSGLQICIQLLPWLYEPTKISWCSKLNTPITKHAKAEIKVILLDLNFGHRDLWLKLNLCHHYNCTWADAKWHLGISCHNVNPLASEKSGWNFKSVIFKLKDRYLKQLLQNCLQISATIPYWWLVNIGSGNGLVPISNKPLP